MTTRAEFRQIVRSVADRTGLAECAVVAAMAERVKRNADAATDPARTAHLDQVAAAFDAEIGPAMLRDHERDMRRYGRQR